MINTPNLSNLISKRQEAIELYEQLYAKLNHDKQAYSRKTRYLKQKKDSTVFDRCCRCNALRKPVDPTMDSSLDSVSLLHKCCCCHKSRKVKALPHLLSELKKINREVEKEYREILDEKHAVEDRATPIHQGMLDAKVARAKNFLTEVGEELTVRYRLSRGPSDWYRMMVVQFFRDTFTDIIFVFAMPKGGDENINIKAQGFFQLYCKMFVMYYKLRKNNELFMYFIFSFQNCQN